MIPPGPAPPPPARSGPGDPLEVMLADIWAELLGRRPVPLGESFATLGGNAALAAAMLERVEHACGLRLPAAARSPDVSIARLAIALRAGAAAARRPAERGLVVRNLPREGRAARPDLFFLHGDFNGGGFYCLALAAHLGKDQPFHGLPPHGLDGMPLPPSIVAMAADRLGTLRALKPHGPYRLAGHCNGALVAFEMARRLSAEGERVDRLILVSPQLPATDRSWPARARARVGALARRMRPRTAAPSAPGGPPPEAGEARFRAYRRIMLDYAPGPYDGALTLLWPADEGVAARARATRRWRRAAPDLRIRLVPGAHLTSITTHAAALAAAMRECLRGEA